MKNLFNFFRKKPKSEPKPLKYACEIHVEKSLIKKAVMKHKRENCCLLCKGIDMPPLMVINVSPNFGSVMMPYLVKTKVWQEINLVTHDMLAHDYNEAMQLQIIHTGVQND